MHCGHGGAFGRSLRKQGPKSNSGPSRSEAQKNGGKEIAGRMAEVFSILSIERRAATPAIRHLRLWQARSIVATVKITRIGIQEIP
jgi:hypothetical protein